MLLPQVRKSQHEQIGELLARFVDVIALGGGRTFYNTAADIDAVIGMIHDEIFKLDRGFYGALMLLPGVRDDARQKAIAKLLGETTRAQSILSLDQETWVVNELIKALPVHRRLKLFAARPGKNTVASLKTLRINNGRTRRRILYSILGDRNLEHLVVAYKIKVHDALTHAWGKRDTGIIKAILVPDRSELWDTHEVKFLRKKIRRFAGDNEPRLVFECISFALGNSLKNDVKWTFPKLNSYTEINQDFQAGKQLPQVVVEGKRSTFHPEKTHDEVLALTAKTATTKQKIRGQKLAKKAGVDLEFNPMQHEPVDLYVLAYATRLTSEIQHALRITAGKLAAALPLDLGHIFIIIDTSESMRGTKKSGSNRPIARALAGRDMLSCAAKSTRTMGDDRFLVKPSGNTNLAGELLTALEADVDTIFVISDGYENRASGRFAELMYHARRIGLDTPVFQLSPVMAGETYGARDLSPLVPVLPLSDDPRSLGLGLLKHILKQNFEAGITQLFKMAVPVLAEEVLQ